MDPIDSFLQALGVDPVRFWHGQGFVREMTPAEKKVYRQAFLQQLREVQAEAARRASPTRQEGE